MQNIDAIASTIFPIPSLSTDTVKGLINKLQNFSAQIVEYIPGKVTITEFVKELTTDIPDMPTAFRQLVQDVSFILPKE